MGILNTQEIGSFRKPEYLSSVFHKAYGTDEFKKLAEKATLETINIFENTGIDNVGIGGEMSRWEMYEHPASQIDGIKFYGMVRSFDNRYYRKGSVTGELKRIRPIHLDEVKFVAKATKKPLKIPITGPYTMMDWSFNDYYDDREALAMEYARIINEEIRDIQNVWPSISGGRKFEVQIDEPATTTHPSEMDIAVEAINRSVDGISGERSLHVCYSTDYRLVYDRIPDLHIDAYNLEYANRDKLEKGISDSERPGYNDIKYFNDINQSLQKRKYLGIGVTDVHIDYVEPAGLIEDRIRYALNIIQDPELLRINPDCGLRTRSRKIGEEKLRNMTEARNRVAASLK